MSLQRSGAWGQVPMSPESETKARVWGVQPRAFCLGLKAPGRAVGAEVGKGEAPIREWRLRWLGGVGQSAHLSDDWKYLGTAVGKVQRPWLSLKAISSEIHEWSLTWSPGTAFFPKYLITSRHGKKAEGKNAQRNREDNAYVDTLGALWSSLG